MQKYVHRQFWINYNVIVLVWKETWHRTNSFLGHGFFKWFRWQEPTQVLSTHGGTYATCGHIAVYGLRHAYGMGWHGTSKLASPSCNRVKRRVLSQHLRWNTWSWASTPLYKLYFSWYMSLPKQFMPCKYIHIFIKYIYIYICTYVLETSIQQKKLNGRFPRSASFISLSFSPR